jgi:hypothetical protein
MLDDQAGFLELRDERADGRAGEAGGPGYVRTADVSAFADSF